MVAITDLGLGSAEDAGAMAASGDAVAISLADGLMVDWSVVGMPCAGKQGLRRVRCAWLRGSGLTMLQLGWEPLSGMLLARQASRHALLCTLGCTQLEA